MGYTIQYEPQKNRKYPPLGHAGRKYTVPLLITFALLLCLGISLRTGWLLPGDPQVTADAFTQMVDSLRAGDELKDAVTAFCSEVLEHGKTA